MQPGLGRWAAADPYTSSLARTGADRAEPTIRLLAGGRQYGFPGASRYEYVVNSPTRLQDPTGLVAIAIGLSGHITAGTGLYGELGVVFGNSPRYSSAFYVTFGVPLAVSPFFGLPSAPGPGGEFVGAGVSIGFGFYWGLDTACQYGGPFVSLAADFAEFGLSVVWSYDSTKPNPIAAMGLPVGFVMSANFDIGLPSVPVQFFMTWSWLFGVWGCDCP